jgi:hypothetical protein
MGSSGGMQAPALELATGRTGGQGRVAACREWQSGLRGGAGRGKIAPLLRYARLAQLVERRPYKANVGGSIPSARTISEAGLA